MKSCSLNSDDRPTAITQRTSRFVLLGMFCILALFAASHTADAGDSLGGETLAGESLGGETLPGDLFSKITMSDTIAQTAASASSVADNSNTILGVISLSKLFSADQIQFDIQAQSLTVRVVDVLPISATMPSVKDATLTLSVDAEANRIDLLLPVRTIANNASIHGPSMIELLAKLTSHSNIQLTVADQTLVLHTSLINQRVTTDQIRTVVRQAVVAAADVQPILASIESKVENAVESKVAEAKQTTPVASPVAATPPASTLMIGTWSAKTSATDAWAIRLADDGSFVMVHTRSGKNSISRGQYTINQNRLTLSETGGVTLKGTLDQTSQKQFSWKLQDDNGKTLTTLAFSKQS